MINILFYGGFCLKKHQKAKETVGSSAGGKRKAMLEVYSPGDMQSPDYECGIWVPICKSIEQNESEAAEFVSTMMNTGIL